MNSRSTFGALLVLLASSSGCSSNEPGDSPSNSGAGGLTNGQSGSDGSAGTPAQAGSSGSGGSTAGAAGGAGVTSGGSAGSGGTGGDSGGTTAGGMGGMAGFEPGDTPPWRPLNVSAEPGEHVHGAAGVDTRAKLLGKLAVDIGVNEGAYVSWLAKRGYHAMGAPCGNCPAPNLGAGRDEVGNCRMQEFANTEAHVTSTLASLHEQFPAEDWGYFLNEDGSVRWSDVALTGISHGATTAAVAGRVGVRLWRVVARAGPRDNTCGAGACSLPLSTPSYDVDCPPENIASWLDQPSLTPINRFYGIDGITDSQCGDISFNMHYTGYPGVPTIFDEPGAVLTGTNQFFSITGGHLDFLRAADVPMNTEAVLDIAFGIPLENQNPDF